MKLVLDTNILLSALIKDSTTRKIIVLSGWCFYYPAATFQEIQKYKWLVLQKSNINNSDYRRLIKEILKKVKIVPEKDLEPYLKEARKVIGQVDLRDVPFVATALSINNSMIWSNDNHFDKQNKVKVLKTKEISTLFLLK
jgi:predicted nucleic acid-binding protein